MMKKLILALFASALFVPLRAADLIGVSQLTDGVIMLQFKDGEVEYSGYGEERSASIKRHEPLDLILAQCVSAYTIVSPDDPAYAAPLHPVKVGRKSKAAEFTRIWPPIQPYIASHDMFLVLPFPMKRGKTYKISYNAGETTNGDTELVFNEFSCRSEAIHVNLAGYKQAHSGKGNRVAEKYAYVSYWMGDLGALNLDAYANRFFYVFDNIKKEPIYVGKLKLRKDFETGEPESKNVRENPGGQFAGADVWECEFSSCPSSGEYIIVVEGIGCSFPFRIDKDIYREVFRITCRGLFLERAGIDKVEPWSKWNHKADHNGAKGYPLYYTRYRWIDSKSEGGDQKEAERLEAGLIPTWGWYHDAGDWDGYPSHQCIPSYLMSVYEFVPKNFTDGELNIPESGNGIPDILDEASWLLNYFRRTKDIARQLGYATGGVPGARVHGDYWHKPDGKPSWEDNRKFYVFGEDPRTSFRYAGQAAQMAWCMKLAGLPDSAAIWYNEAIETYEWALKNTLPGDNILHDRIFASSWLFKYTGQEKYHKRFVTDLKSALSDNYLPGGLNNNYLPWAVWAYATNNQPGVKSDLKQRLENLSVKWADSLNIYPWEHRAYRFGIDWSQPTIVGHATTPNVFPAIVAWALTGEGKYYNCVLHTADYHLGGNNLNMCWVTGLGARSPKEILHLDSWVDNVDEVIEGQVPYGPNRLSNRGDFGFNGPWDSDYQNATAYPDESQWPAHELWFENRYCPITNEYTVHQNIGPAAAVYGFLCSPSK